MAATPERLPQTVEERLEKIEALLLRFADVLERLRPLIDRYADKADKKGQLREVFGRAPR